VSIQITAESRSNTVQVLPVWRTGPALAVHGTAEPGGCQAEGGQERCAFRSDMGAGPSGGLRRCAVCRNPCTSAEIRIDPLQHHSNQKLPPAGPHWPLPRQVSPTVTTGPIWTPKSGTNETGLVPLAAPNPCLALRATALRPCTTHSGMLCRCDKPVSLVPLLGVQIGPVSTVGDTYVAESAHMWACCGQFWLEWLLERSSGSLRSGTDLHTSQRGVRRKGPSAHVPSGKATSAPVPPRLHPPGSAVPITRQPGPVPPTSSTWTVFDRDSAVHLDGHAPGRKVPVKSSIYRTGRECPVVLFSPGMGGNREHGFMGTLGLPRFVSVHLQHQGTDTSIGMDSTYQPR